MSFKPIPTLDGTQANFTGNINSAGDLTVNGGDITLDGAATSTFTIDTSNSFGRELTLSTNGTLPTISANSDLLIETSNSDTQVKLEGGGSTDNIQFVANEVEQVRITTSGVGIGTTSPSGILHLASAGPAVLTVEADTDNATETDNARIVLKQDGALVVGRIGYENNTNALEIINQFNDSLSLGTNNTKRLTINGAGYAHFTSRVGINISSPEQELHVYQGTAKFESTNGNDVSLQLGRSDNANLWNFNHAGNDLRIYNAGGSGYDILLGVNAGGAVQSNKVGVSTATPLYRLDVGGSVSSASNTIRMVQANNGTAIRIGAGGGSNDVNLLRVDGNTSTATNTGQTDSSNFGFSLRYKGSGSGANNSLAFFADNATAGSQIEALTILNDGKVGIGATAPSTALHVEGTITHKVYTVSALPSASPAGQRSFVSDASSVLDVNLGATVSAGGSNLVPVFSDGSNWIVG